MTCHIQCRSRTQQGKIKTYLKRERERRRERERKEGRESEKKGERDREERMKRQRASVRNTQPTFLLLCPFSSAGSSD